MNHWQIGAAKITRTVEFEAMRGSRFMHLGCNLGCLYAVVLDECLFYG